MSEKKEPRKVVDWEAIEPHWRAGIMSKLELSKRFGVSRAALDKHFDKEGITRDLTKRIQDKADALVTQALVTPEVTQHQKLQERQIVEVNAAALVQVRLSHRTDIARARNVVMSLFEELESVCGSENAELLAQLGELMRNPDDNGQDKLNDLYKKLMSLPGRAKTMKDLGDSLKTMVGLEREAFGLNDSTVSLDRPAKRITLDFVDVVAR